MIHNPKAIVSACRPAFILVGLLARERLPEMKEIATYGYPLRRLLDLEFVIATPVEGRTWPRLELTPAGREYARYLTQLSLGRA